MLRSFQADNAMLNGNTLLPSRLGRCDRLAGRRTRLYSSLVGAERVRWTLCAAPAGCKLILQVRTGAVVAQKVRPH